MTRDPIRQWKQKHRKVSNVATGMSLAYLAGMVIYFIIDDRKWRKKK